MKSYLRFLSRNKLYTAIEVVGLSIALGFILILSSYIIDDLSTDREIKNKEELLVCHNEGHLWSHKKLHVEAFDKLPEIESYCRITDKDIERTIQVGDNEHLSVEPLYASGNFFEFFGYRLLSGNPSEVLSSKGSGVISESLAEQLFTNENPIGQSITILDHDEEMQPFWTEIRITGVFRKPHKSIILNSEIILNIEDWRGYNEPGEGGHCNLIKVKKGTDLDQLDDKIFKLAAEAGNIFYKHNFATPVKFTPLDKLDSTMQDSSANDCFKNLPDRKMARTFLIACVILLVFAILNYISLTVAFSRFRNKEMATRRLLGSFNNSLTVRSFMESFMLTGLSFSIGIMLAVLLQEKSSYYLAKEIRLFSYASEIVWSLILLVTISIVTSLVPAYIASGNKPIDVIKGEARHKDKSILGKVFIGLQSMLSIICVSISIAIWSQTEKMIDTPLGYETENIVCIEGFPYPDQIHSELESLPCIKRLGKVSSYPIEGSTVMTNRTIGNEVIGIKAAYCDTTALSILGIDIIERYADIGNYSLLLPESSLEYLKNELSSKGASPDKIREAFQGIVTDFRFGNLAAEQEGVNAILIVPSIWGNEFVAEVTGDTREAVKDIKSFIYGLDLENRFDLYEYDLDVKINTMQDMVEASYEKEKESLTLIGVFAILCIILTSMAIIGLSCHYAQLNRHDTAVRKVFGISHKEVFWNTVWGFCLPVLAGAVAAIPLAYIYIGHWLESYPVRITNSPLIYIYTLAIIMLIVVASVALQAFRLMRTNPAEALKKE